MRAFLVTALLILAAARLAAGEVRVPLQLDYPFLRELLVNRAFTDPEKTARVLSDGVDCNRVVLRDPQLGARDGRLHVTSAVDAKFGTLVLGLCLLPVAWQGQIDSELEPVLDPELPLVRFRVRESKLVEGGSAPARTTGMLWDWVKRYVHPRLELFAIDLAAPLRDLRAVLPLFLADRDTPRAQALIDSLALEAAEIGDAGVTVMLRLTPPSGEPAPPAGSPEPELSAEELARFEAALARWDGFVTFVVKHAGGRAAEPELRQRLLEVLIDTREAVLLTAAEPHAAGADPVRPLFLDTWRELSGVLRALGPTLPDSDALRYLSFVAAADALAALDALGPEMGVEISSDGLRRLARILVPDATDDPLATPDGVDPDLRRVFGFDVPLAPPELDPELDPDPELEIEPAPAPVLAPPAPESLSPWRRLGVALLSPGSWWIAEARAASAPIQTELTRDQLARLNRWVPQRNELAEYLPQIRLLLRSSAAQVSDAKSLANPHRKLFLDMQLATAWQESCWRQYVRSRGRVLPIRSHAGAVGLMQVNARVWRGFYDTRGLSGDIAYNARAGGEILLHYLVDFALKRREHERPGGLDNLARAAYAAYNGGPRHLRRYRLEKTPRSLRAIDKSFWSKLEAVRAGRELEVARCFG